MSSTNGSSRPPGCVSIPVEIIRDSGSTGSGSHSRHNSPFRTLHNDNTYGGFADSPPWSTNSTSRFQPRQSPSAAYDRVITNSHFNQPVNDHSSYQQPQPEPQYRPSQQRLYEPGPSQFSRSSEDLLSSPFDSTRYTVPPQYTSLIPPTFDTGFPQNSDFVQSNKYSNPLRRSFDDALNNFADMHSSFPTYRQSPTEQRRQPQTPPRQQQQQQQQQQQPYYRSAFQTQHQRQPQQQQQQPTYVNQAYINPNIVYTNEYGVPTDQYQPNPYQEIRNSATNDRSRSPNSPRGASPARQPPAPSPSSFQQQEEPELKMAKDTEGPIPMPGPAPPSTSSSTPSTDQQVPPQDPPISANIPPPPPPPSQPEHPRDPNVIALEKLEQLKQSLDTLEKEVDTFAGSTRNERAYKMLDEQALKIMIRCDELVDVSADIKEKRKEMIRNVQRVISKLESKVPATPAATESNSNPLAGASTSIEESSVKNQEVSSEKKSSPSSSPGKETKSEPTTTEQSIST